MLTVLNEIDKRILSLKNLADFNKRAYHHSYEDRIVADAEVRMLDMGIEHFESLAEFIRNS